MRRLWKGWPDDGELLLSVRDAQRQALGALDALLAGLWPTLVTFFVRHVVIPDDAEDLAQQALIRIAHALPQIDPERAGRYLDPRGLESPAIGIRAHGAGCGSAGVGRSFADTVESLLHG